MNLKQFDKALENHDWMYMYADDGRWYRAGRDNAIKLERIAKTSPEHEELFLAWCDWINQCDKEDSTEKRDEVRRRLCGQIN